NRLAVNAYLRSKRLSLGIPIDTLVAGFIIHLASTITIILRAGHCPKVADAIVKPVVVCVVKLTLGPFPIVNRPDNPVGPVHSAENSPLPVSTVVYRRERLFVRVPGSPCAVSPFGFEHLHRQWLPIKFPRIRLVTLHLAIFFSRLYNTLYH